MSNIKVSIGALAVVLTASFVVYVCRDKAMHVSKSSDINSAKNDIDETFDETLKTAVIAFVKVARDNSMTNEEIETVITQLMNGSRAERKSELRDYLDWRSENSGFFRFSKTTYSAYKESCDE